MSNVLHVGPEVSLFEVLDTLEHVDGSVVEVGLGTHLGVGEEVDQGSLLDELVLLIDPTELELVLGELEVVVLHHLDGVSPLVRELGVLVSGVGVVEHRELGAREESEVLDLDVANVIGEEELVMPNHSSQPVVVLPTAEPRDSVDGSDVKT